MRRHKFTYEVVAGEEYQLLKSDLIRVQESMGNFSFAVDIKLPTSKDAFFKVLSPYNASFQCRLRKQKSHRDFGVCDHASVLRRLPTRLLMLTQSVF
jgi:hypothetical protein